MNKKRQLKKILKSELKEMVKDINNIWSHNNINNEEVIMNRHINILLQEITSLMNVSYIFDKDINIFLESYSSLGKDKRILLMNKITDLMYEYKALKEA